MDHGKAALCGGKVATIGAAPLRWENDVTDTTLNHGTQRGGKIDFVANEDPKFHAEVGCENSNILRCDFSRVNKELTNTSLKISFKSKTCHDQWVGTCILTCYILYGGWLHGHTCAGY